MVKPLSKYEQNEIDRIYKRLIHLWKVFNVSPETIKKRLPEQYERIRSGVQERWDMSMTIQVPEHIYTLILDAPSKD